MYGEHVFGFWLWQVSHEAPVTGGFGGEIAASITESCFLRVLLPHHKFPEAKLSC